MFVLILKNIKNKIVVVSTKLTNIMENKLQPQKNFDIGKKLEEIARRFVLKNQTTKNEKVVVTSFVCKFCEKRFLKNRYLSHHINKIHNSHKCDICDKKFTSEKNLNGHICVNYQCDTCKASFFQKHRLEKHINSVHNKRQQKDFKCDNCEKSFFEKGNLKKHVLRIHEQKDHHKCDICDKLFAEKGNLKKHINSVHKDQKESKKDKKGKSTKGKLSAKGSTKNSQIDKSLGKIVNTTEDGIQNLEDNWKVTVTQTKVVKPKPKININENENFNQDIKMLMAKGVLKKVDKKEVKTENKDNEAFQVHNGEKIQKCDLCEQISSQLGQLEKHFVIVHKGDKHVITVDNDSDEIKCYICCNFFHKSELEKHQRTVHPIQKT